MSAFCSFCLSTCRTSDPGENSSCCVVEPAQEVREVQQAEAEDVAAAAVREMGLAANMRPEDDDDDDGDGDGDDEHANETDEDHFNRIRGLIHTLANAATRRDRSGAGPSGIRAGGSRGGGGGGGGRASGGEGSSGASSSSGVSSRSGAGPSGAAAAVAPLYRDFEDDDDLD